MDYLSFFCKLQQEDSRVKFVKADKCFHYGDLEIPTFYQTVNPVDVEFEFHDGIVKLEPFESLAMLNETYSYVTDGCVFATCNGDPIYIKDGGIYICVHGAKRIVEEKIASSMEELFEQIMNTL